jgi:hypothetical protein
MSRTWLWVGIVLIVIAIGGGIAAAAARHHWNDDHGDYRVISTGDDGATGDHVTVVDDGRRWGGPPFLPVFPFVVIGGVIIVLALTSGRRRQHWGAGGRDADFERWHREAHWNWGPAASQPPAPPPPPGAPPEDE